MIIVADAGPLLHHLPDIGRLHIKLQLIEAALAALAESRDV